MKLNYKLIIAILFLVLGMVGLYYDALDPVLAIVFCFAGMISVLLLLNYPSDWVEDSLGTISYRFKVSALLAGGLFLAVASSSPEFFTSLSGVVWHRVFDIGFDTLIWSAIFNLCMILGICTLYNNSVNSDHLVVNKSIIKRDMPFYGFAIVVLLILALDGTYSRLDFVLLITLYIGYVITLYFDKSEPYKESGSDTWTMILIKLVVGIALIAFFAHMMVSFGEETRVIALEAFEYTLPVGLLAATIYGPGTSIADLFMSISATKKGEGSAAIVNGISSNTFDLTICLGVPGLIYTFTVKPVITIDLHDSILLIGMLLISYLIVFFFLFDKKLTKKEAQALIAYYIVATIIYLLNEFEELEWLKEYFAFIQF